MTVAYGAPSRLAAMKANWVFTAPNWAVTSPYWALSAVIEGRYGDARSRMFDGGHGGRVTTRTGQ
ncbi:hypothetical protein GCM10011579_060870 [Streptomyces albiflavescens]|uniref:Uncharacterized protein n=1 Tax=Streptomyces albiflavescens TaxID=1623582 RepID=A0A918D6Z0_9ACTN|nr:hypothetical protein GCM10011579_060870 [Streptomyces albiflavescens]